MRRRTRGTTGRQSSAFSGRQSRSAWQRQRAQIQPVSKTRRPTQGRVRSGPSNIVRARPSTRRVSGRTVTSRRVASSWQTRNQLRDPTRIRRARVLSQRGRTRARLSPALMPVRRSNENASRNETTRSVCTRKKQARRAVIIATGYGGRNGRRDYRQRSKCK